jgi:CheY-like chemotaxis protein/anti-sigma regulatory factor (Ser/Thr protein kinase)
MSSLLQDSDLTDEQSELLNVVMFSARTIDRLIRDLTDLTQIRTGKITIYREDFNLEELCRHILESNRPEAVKKGLDLDSTVDAAVSHFTGDRERIGQIVSNLLINAIKYTELGQIRLSAAAVDNELRIDVIDTGIGIPQEQQKEVFGLFKQGRIGRRAEGTGIGLAVVKELAEVMNGRVLLESEPGIGSRFTVFLPLKSEPGKREPSNEDMNGGSLPDVARILVAEDEGVNRLYMRTFLEREGWDIDEAANGVEAVSLARQNKYDLILMDISMPRMDGLEASALIREIQPFVPIIAITAHAYEEDRQRILDAGLNDIVLKPIDENGLKRRLRRYLRTS